MQNVANSSPATYCWLFAQRERERERERDRQTDRQTDRQRQRQTDRRWGLGVGVQTALTER